MLRHMQGVFDECTYDAISEMHSIARDVPRQNYWKMDTVVEQYWVWEREGAEKSFSHMNKIG